MTNQTPIEKIRAEVERVRKQAAVMKAFSAKSGLRCAEDKLKLAEALVQVRSQCGGHADEFSGSVWRIAERVLAEVSR
jgi:hypothetical protein